MDTMEAIMTRRSVRKYKDKPVSDELIRQLLHAAMQAPSAANEQPWQFIVIKDHNVLDQVPTFHAHSHMVKQAAVAILICEDPSLEVYSGRGPLDCANAAENMLLAAHSLGLGAVWVGIYPVEERINGIRKLLGIPSSVIPIALVSIGYPDEKPPVENRFKSDRVHYERWMGHKTK
jgi:nitroreductase